MLNLDVYQKYNSLRRRGVPPQLKDLHLLLICFGTNSEEQQSAGFARDVCTKFARFNAQARDVNDFKKACQDSALSLRSVLRSSPTLQKGIETSREFNCIKIDTPILREISWAEPDHGRQTYFVARIDKLKNALYIFVVGRRQK